MDWLGAEPPATDPLPGAKVFDVGLAHVRAIVASGGQVLGWRDLAWDDNEPGEFLTACVGGVVARGAVYRRRATRADQEHLPMLGTNCFSVPKLMAEELAGGRVTPGRPMTP